MFRSTLSLLAATCGLACGPGVLPSQEQGSGGGTAMGDEPGETATSDSEVGGDAPMLADLPTVQCEPDAVSCGASIHGTWRLATADSSAVAYLYLSISMHTGEEHFLLYTLDESGAGECRRYADYVPEGDVSGTFWVQESNLGGTFGETCGEPGDESFIMMLTRRTECEDEVFDFTLERPGSVNPEVVEGQAIHCRCDVDWDSLGGDPVFPQDGCVGP